VGVLVIVALSALAALIFLMSNSTGGFWSGHLMVRSYFENSAGLKIGAPVSLEGLTVGSVTGMRIVPDRKLTPVEVTMRINKKYQDGIRQDSKTSLTTMGVLGDTVVDIDSKFATAGLVQNNTELPTTETPNLQDVIQASQGTIQQLDTILAKVNALADDLTSGKGSIGLLINDPTLYNKAVLTISQLQALIDAVTNGKGSVGKLVNDDTFYNRDQRRDQTRGHHHPARRGQGKHGQAPQRRHPLQRAQRYHPQPESDHRFHQRGPGRRRHAHQGSKNGRQAL
jgi:phospholipid/cholesterol/gamma-HCH transport system substrate-binding protein